MGTHRSTSRRRSVVRVRTTLLQCAVFWCASLIGAASIAFETGESQFGLELDRPQRDGIAAPDLLPRTSTPGARAGAEPFAFVARNARLATNSWTINRAARPHPAVARIVVAEGLATSYGSGTLIDRRDDYGLVVTNWHVVRDAQGDIEVLFPDGFSSKARALKVDPDWDLAALVVWRPSATPVKIADAAPQPGDRLTICGYGQGQYREATGRCTKYYAPRLNLPEHMVELDVEARQGDSGGPIFNESGELAGVLFGAGEGTTLGSFGGRVQAFLATLAPNIGGDSSWADSTPDSPRPDDATSVERYGVVQRDAAKAGWTPRASDRSNSVATSGETSIGDSPGHEDLRLAAHAQSSENAAAPNADGWQSAAEDDVERTTPPSVEALGPRQVGWFDHLKSILAAVGVVAIVIQLLKAVR